MERKVCLLILDGAGYSTTERGNAVTAETLPSLFGHMHEHGFAVLGAAAEAVGLEPGQVGNSEAGHMTIGAGEIVPCMTQRISNAFEDGSWAAHPGWKPAVEAGIVHLLGLVSDAGVHAFARTIVQAAETASRAGVSEIVVHAVLDGVDSLAGSAPRILGELRNDLSGLPNVSFGVVVGRKHFCDRSGDLEVSRVVVDAFRGKQELPPFTDQALAEHLADGRSEMSFPPHLSGGARFVADGEPVMITSNRADRARQVAKLLTETQPVLMCVDPGKDVPVDTVFFPIEPLQRGLAHTLRDAGIPSVRVAEKCKFPHVTFFFNGFDTTVEGEGICIPSIPEGDIPAQPQMSAAEITAEVKKHLADPARRVVIANLANLDQVGHLGRHDLAKQAAAEVDARFREIAAQAAEHGWTLFVTADHGNAERVEDEAGQPFGSHTDEPVFLLAQPAPGTRLEWTTKEGSLANVAATCLTALGVEPPAWMEPSLVRWT